jgi:hypothetical protein
MSEMITIKKSEYEQLLEDQRFLNALERAGVDNWDGYEEAQELMEEWDA